MNARTIATLAFFAAVVIFTLGVYFGKRELLAAAADAKRSAVMGQ